MTPSQVRLLVLIGPPSEEKSNILRVLEGRRTSVTPVWTTRPRSQDELRGVVEHRFVSEEEFAGLVESGAFVETFSTDGLPHRYGLPPLQPPRRPGLVQVIAMRVETMEIVDRLHPDRVIYQVEAEDDTARNRLRAKYSDPDELAVQQEAHEAERLAGHEIADRVFDRHESPDDFLREVQAALEQDYPPENPPPT